MTQHEQVARRIRDLWAVYLGREPEKEYAKAAAILADAYDPKEGTFQWAMEMRGLGFMVIRAKKKGAWPTLPMAPNHDIRFNDDDYTATDWEIWQEEG